MRYSTKAIIDGVIAVAMLVAMAACMGRRQNDFAVVLALAAVVYGWSSGVHLALHRERSRGDRCDDPDEAR